MDQFSLIPWHHQYIHCEGPRVPRSGNTPIQFAVEYKHQDIYIQSPPPMAKVLKGLQMEESFLQIQTLTAMKVHRPILHGV